MTTFAALMTELDTKLTGKVSEAALENARQQAHKLADPMPLFEGEDYYLSDGGYSRVYVRESVDEQRLYEFMLSGVSRQAVINRWNEPGVIDLREKIEAILRAFVQDQL